MLAADWVPPEAWHWTAHEQQIFQVLMAGGEFEGRTPEEKAAAGFTLTAHRHWTVKGTFISQVLRELGHELPIGIKLQGVKINGKIDIENIQIDKVISLEHCYIVGPIIAVGSKFLWFSLTGSVLEGYLDMRSANISGGLFLRDGFKSLTSTLLRDTVVSGTIDCSRAVFKYSSDRIDDLKDTAEGESCSLARCSASALFWRDMPEPPTGIVNLRNCRIGSLRDCINNPADVARDWPAAGGLRMSGLKYEDRTSSDPDALLAWIGLQNIKESRYGSYQTAIKLLSDNGQELSANKIIVAKQRYIAQHEQSVLNSLLRRLYIGLSDAGVGTDRIAGFALLAFILSFLIVLAADSRGEFVPKSNDILKDACFTSASKPCLNWVPYRSFFIPSYYPQFNPFGYTVDLFVPGVSYGVAADWRPESDAMTAVTVAIRAIGFLLTGLLVVCASGIARFAR